MLLDKALELGKMIAQSQEFKDMQQAEDNLRGDLEAQKMIHDIQEMQRTFNSMQMNGQQITQENIQEIKDLESKAMQNSKVAAFYDTSKNFHHLVEHVNNKIQEGMTGKPPGQGC